MATNNNEQHCVINNPPAEIKQILSKIKSCHQNDDYNVFITSDYPNILNIAAQVWDTSKIIYEDSIIQHIDRTPINTDISKIFIDSYILSQKTSTLYISDYSNFGRIAALSCNHNNIFNYNTKKIDIRNLVSKHEKLYQSNENNIELIKDLSFTYDRIYKYCC